MKEKIITKKILKWYDLNKRSLPWRKKVSLNRKQYYTLISEFMLQQTQVTTVIPFFNRFIKNLPSINSLAKVSEKRLIKLWEGLGYYSRARNLKKTAQLIIKNFNGKLPNDLEDLLTLPGIGNYTANDVGNIIYAYFLGLILMHNEFKYKRMSQQYASRTGSYGNFNFFRNNGTDLYLLIHSIMGTGSIVQFKNDESSKQYVERLQANAMSMREMLGILSRDSLPDLTRTLMRFERELKVNESVLKKVRRLVTDYDKLKQKERQNIVIKIEQYLRGSVPKSELYGILQSMAKERQLKNRVTVNQKKLPKNVAAGAKR